MKFVRLLFSWAPPSRLSSLNMCTHTYTQRYRHTERERERERDRGNGVEGEIAQCDSLHDDHLCKGIFVCGLRFIVIQLTSFNRNNLRERENILLGNLGYADTLTAMYSPLSEVHPKTSENVPSPTFSTLSIILQYQHTLKHTTTHALLVITVE